MRTLARNTLMLLAILTMNASLTREHLPLPLLLALVACSPGLALYVIIRKGNP